MTDNAKAALGALVLIGIIAYGAWRWWQATPGSLPATSAYDSNIAPAFGISNSPSIDPNSPWLTPYYLRANYPAASPSGDVMPIIAAADGMGGAGGEGLSQMALPQW